jgi:RNA-binding protein YhbY
VARSPWSRPGGAPAPTEADLEWAREEARTLNPELRVGHKTGLRQNIVAGLNARLAEHELVKVEFIKIPPAKLDEMIRTLERGTASVCVARHGQTATFFRRHPNRPSPGQTS